jgi:hypothetical protein
MPDKGRYERLNSELGRIHDQVRDLKVSQYVFWEVQDIISKNDNLRKPSTFYGWMGKMYASSMSASVRRLVDQRRGALSLVRLLEEVKANLSLFSREEYKNRCTNPNVPADYIEGDYDKLVGKGNRLPDPAAIAKDISSLKEKTEILKKFVDENIAHAKLEERKDQDIPKFQDLDDAIEFVEQLVKRYLHLFRGVGMSTLLPTWTYDWKEIFRYPWIEVRDQPMPPENRAARS